MHKQINVKITSKDSLLKLINIGDEVSYLKGGVRSGIVDFVSRKGINVKSYNSNKTTFVKWCNVFELIK